MDLGVISMRYARAFLKSAVQMKCEDKVYEDMTTIVRSYFDVPQLRKAIDNPMLCNDDKKNLLKTAAGKNLTELTERFFNLILKEGRAKAMLFIATSYITLYRKQKNIIYGKLITAVPISSETEQKMKRMVQQKADGTVEFLTEVDPNIIGGFILEYDTFRMDNSVQSQLRTILKQIK